jgi:hypothetical protein
VCDAVVAQQTSSSSTSMGRARRAPWWSQVILILGLYWVYDAVNNLAATRQLTALADGRSLLKLENWLQINHEHALNAWATGHHYVGLFLADYYDVMHLTLTFVLICVLWWARPDLYRELRIPLVLTNLVGFVVFWVYPVAPPRMLPGFVDTVAVTHAIGSWHTGTLAQAANEFAAMPSLHVAWALWCYVAIRRAWPDNRWATVAAAVHVALTAVCVIATANHYMLDALAGALTAVVCFALAKAIATALQRRSVVAEPVAS